MRVLHVIETLSEAYGGPVAACLTQCRALRDLGVGVEIFTTDITYPRGAAADGGISAIDGVPVRRFRSWFRPYAFAPGLWRELRQMIRSFDLIHIHGLYRFPMAAAARLARANGVPYVCQPHGSLDPFHHDKPERRTRKRVYERFVEMPALTRAAALLFTAEEERRRAVAAPAGPRKLVVPLGVDIARYVPPAQNDFRRRHGLGDRPLILFMGRLAPQKALDVLADALGMLVRDHPDALLLLAGPDHGTFRRQVEGWLAANGVGANAMFLGMVTGAEKAAMLAAADIFVLPSHMENFGVSLVEAMAAGLPVVISDRVDIGAAVAQAGAGLVVPREPGRIAGALHTFLDDADLRRRAGAAGRELVAARFEMHAAGRLLLEAYRSVMGAGQG